MTADIRPGDRVRWWPDGHDDDGQALFDRYIDGIQLDRGRSYIQVTGSHGFTERWPGGWRVPAIGGVMDTSVSPGTIQRLNTAPRPYARAALLAPAPPRYPRRTR